MGRDLSQVNAQDHGTSMGETSVASMIIDAPASVIEVDPLALETAVAKTTRKTKKTETTETE